MSIFRTICGAALLALAATAGQAATCGDTAQGYDRWKSAFADRAAAAGVGPRGLQALADSRYAQRTIDADRNQRSFDYSFDRFMELRGAETIVAQGRDRLAANPGLYSALEQRYGVPPGILIAIHGMETGFGRFMGNSNVVSSILTLAYDCRRSDFFTPHALGALQLVDRGAISPATQGARHGELGHTQFLPANVIRYGVDGNGDGRVDLADQVDALASTANYMRAHGWQPGQGYQPGQPNFRVIEEWNAASVYQRAIAEIAGRIDR